MRAEHLKVLLQDQPALELLAYAATRLANAKHRSRTGFSSAHCCQQARWWRAWHSNGRRVPPPGVACFGERLGNNSRPPLPICFASTSGHGCTGGPCPCDPWTRTEPGARIAGWAQRVRQHLTHLVSDCAQIRRARTPSFREACLRPSFHVLPHTAGGTSRGKAAISPKEKGANKATLGQHAALCQASSALHGSERLLAFFDDLYVLTAREARDAVVQAVLQEGCGIASTEGKTRVYSHAGGEPPPGIAELGADVWRGNKRSSERGLKVLGTPIGHPHFIASWAESRMLTERELLNQLPRFPDLQCAWLLLAMCASPRANHALRTVPPLDIAGYAQAHDDAAWETLQACLGGVASGEADGERKLATLPASRGGLGLASAVRTAPAAYWAAWADALPVLGERAPALAEACVRQLEGRDAETTCLRSAAVARNLLQAEGWQECPSWRAIADGARPPVATERSLGDWPHGWQHSASRTRNLHFRERTLLPDMSPSACALLRSQAGPHAGAWLTAIPTDPATTLSPQAMQLAFRRRLRLPLPLRLNRCGPSPGCGGLVDVFATMPWPALALGSLLGEPRSSNGRG